MKSGALFVVLDISVRNEPLDLEPQQFVAERSQRGTDGFRMTDDGLICRKRGRPAQYGCEAVTKPLGGSVAIRGMLPLDGNIQEALILQERHHTLGQVALGSRRVPANRRPENADVVKVLEDLPPVDARHGHDPSFGAAPLLSKCPRGLLGTPTPLRLPLMSKTVSVGPQVTSIAT